MDESQAIEALYRALDGERQSINQLKIYIDYLTKSSLILLNI